MITDRIFGCFILLSCSDDHGEKESILKTIAMYVFNA